MTQTTTLNLIFDETDPAGFRENCNYAFMMFDNGEFVFAQSNHEVIMKSRPHLTPTFGGAIRYVAEGYKWIQKGYTLWTGWQIKCTPEQIQYLEDFLSFRGFDRLNDSKRKKNRK